MLASPARRARQTAQALTKKLEIVEDLGTGASPQGVLKAAGWPERDGIVVVVGHQPTLGQTIALALTGQGRGLEPAGKARSGGSGAATATCATCAP